MIEAGSLLLLRPWWLAALPALGLCWWLARRDGGLAGWARVIDRELMPVLGSLGHVIRPLSRTGPLVPLAVASTLALALSGPAQRNDHAPSFGNLDGTILVMDMSPSVARGGGLDDAQAAAAYLLERIGGRPVGLILFAGEPYLVSAMTTDAATLASPIAVLDAETMPDAGSRPDRALAMAGGVLAEAGIVGGDVVLISDGGGIGPAAAEEARRIARAGGRVSTVFVAPAAAPPDMPAPDPEALAGVADAGGGVAATVGDVDRIADGLRRSRTSSLARSGLAPLLFTDLGRLLVAVALVPALLLFRRSA